MKKEFTTLTVIILLLLAMIAPLWINMTAKASPIDAFITGNVYDHGEDTDYDTSYNYLVAEVEVNVTVAGTYRIQVNRLKGEHQDEYLWFFVSNETYLEEGIQNITVLFNGIPIHGRRINVTQLVDVYLYDAEGNLPSSWSELNLTKTYNYTLFDVGATFTGTIVDSGVDTDSDGLYDYLDIGIEVNVEDAGSYAVYAYNLANASYYYYINVYSYCYAQLSLPQGTYYVNFSIYGPTIYASHVTNISTINWLILDYKYEQIYSWYRVDERYSLPLSNLYNYTDFESHAQLTEKIVDEGVDTDGNGLLDYLRVGVEINVTEAGYYRVVIYELVENETNSLYIGEQVENHFDLGNHTIYFEFYGPMFAYEHFSPANLSDIRLYEVNTGAGLGYIPSASLSQIYDYTLFDVPSKDMQIYFTVYPNGTTGVNGELNFTRMYPQNTGPAINASIDISTAGSTTQGSFNGSLAFHRGDMSGPPLDSIVANFTSKYEEGLVNSTLDFTLFMPPEVGANYPLNATDFNLISLYKNGMLNVEVWGETELPESVSKAMFPLNATDLTIRAEYADNQLIGNITFHLLVGVPELDVIVYFSGNQTDLQLTGHVNVTYGDYFGMELSSTTLEEMLNMLNSSIPGPTGLVANMTWGLLECTTLDTTKTEWTNGLGADVQYNASIHGNFTFFFARALTQMFFGEGPNEEEQTIYAALSSAFSSIKNASLTLYYYHGSGIAEVGLDLTCDVKALWGTALELIPSTVPPENSTQVEALLKIQNITAHAIQDFSFNATYSGATQRLDLDAYLLSNATQLDEELRLILPDAIPPELRAIFESYISVTYCNLTYSEMALSLVNGTATFEANWVCEGDFKAQLNHVKHFYIDYLNATSPWMFNWQLRLLNETQININNIKADFKLTQDSMYLTFNGVIAQPPRDDIDFIRFKFYRLFNMTSEDPYEPPMEFEKLKVVITSGFNGTHTILLYAPGTIPTPDDTSLDYKSMTWQNVSFSKLKDLLFQIAYQGVINYLGETHYVPIFTNSTVDLSTFHFNPDAKTISFNVTGTTGTGFCNITIPRALLDATELSDWVVKIDGTPLSSGEFAVTRNDAYVFIYLNYSHSSHIIEVEGTWVVAEYPLNILLLMLIALSFIAVVIAVKQRKKLSAIKTTYQRTVGAYISKLHQLLT